MESTQSLSVRNKINHNHHCSHFNHIIFIHIHLRHNDNNPPYRQSNYQNSIEISQSNTPIKTADPMVHYNNYRARHNIFQRNKDEP